MRFFITILFAVLVLCSCGENEKEDVIIALDEESYIDSFLEDHDLHPTQREDINHIAGVITTNNFQYIFGQKNHNGWICKFDLTGSELQSKELPKLDGWNYSYYEERVYNDDNFALLRCCYSNNYNQSIPNTNDDVFISILDLANLKETDKIKIKKEFRPQVFKENGRYTIAFWRADMDKKNIYIVGSDGIIKYSVDWDSNKEEYFSSYCDSYRSQKNVMMFLTDEIVAPVLSYHFDRFSSNFQYEYKIINLKDWKLVKTINIKPHGEYLGENGISYSTDTTYLDGNNIKYVYRESKRIVDEISGNEKLIVLNKYYYHIDAKTYEVSYMGKLE